MLLPGGHDPHSGGSGNKAPVGQTEVTGRAARAGRPACRGSAKCMVSSGRTRRLGQGGLRDGVSFPDRKAGVLMGQHAGVKEAALH